MGCCRARGHLLVVLLIAAAHVAAQRQCYSNGDGLSTPTRQAKKVYCAFGEQCVALNHYGDTSAALWPLDARGEKCYRFCKKMKVDSTWNTFFQDAEETIRVYSRDESYQLYMTCDVDLCNEHCLDEDAAMSLAPSLSVLVACLLATCLARLV